MAVAFLVLLTLLSHAHGHYYEIKSRKSLTGSYLTVKTEYYKRMGFKQTSHLRPDQQFKQTRIFSFSKGRKSPYSTGSKGVWFSFLNGCKRWRDFDVFQSRKGSDQSTTEE
eukprot:753383_1